MKKVIIFIIIAGLILVGIGSWYLYKTKTLTPGEQNSQLQQEEMEALPFNTGDNLDDAIEELKYIED